MKKILDLGSLVGIVAALLLLGYVLLPQRPAQAAAGGAFKDFPVGQTRVIRLAARGEALEELTPRERLDQTRDWLLFATVSYAGLPADEINKALFDLPLTRQRFMRQVANFEYGDTRACYIGSGQVLALLPADASEERAERIARIADEHRKNLGAAPAEMQVFEYELRPADDGWHQTVLLTRREAVKVKDLYTPAAGYHEAKIGGLEDLRRFMAQVDDLTYASLKDGLTLGGRKIKGHAYRGIRVEEVAALYQSEAKLRERAAAFKKKAEEFGARWERRAAVRWDEQSKREFRLEYAALLGEQQKALATGSLAGGSGFSLDPTYNYPKLAAQFDAVIAPQLRRLLSGTAMPSALTGGRGALSTPALGGLPTPDNSVEQWISLAREGLALNNADKLFELLGLAKDASVEGAAVVRRHEQEIQESYSYQAARYDGELQGSEAGMVLFYTDLLAKLWALNYKDSAPAGDVPGFTPIPAMRISTAFKRELEELSHTRLWFGTQDKGFQVADGGQSLLLGRVATRVYAASSNPFNPGAETEPNAQSAAFLGWWDDHYEEIARFEPEYERLNEIMKWSLVVTWLNQKEQGGRLGFLQDERVGHDNWFPDWVTRHHELRYQHWADIAFNPRGSDGAATETLPRLSSDPYRLFGLEGTLSGGVSLADEGTFVARAALSAETKVAPTVLRSNLNLAESTGSTLKTIEGAVYRLSSAGADSASTTVTARAAARLRSTFGEVANQPVERAVTRVEGRVSFRSAVGDVPQGELTVSEAGNGFSVGWASRDMDTGASLARRLSGAHDPSQVLAHHPDVAEALALPDGGGYLVKLEGSDRWLKVTPEAPGSTTLGEGQAGRVGDLRAGAQNYDFSWVKSEEASAGLSRGAQRLRQVAGESEPGDAFRLATGGDYVAAARSMEKGPEVFKSRLETVLGGGLQECKDMLRDGQFEMASRQLDVLIDLYGPRPELRLHKLIADLNVPRETRSELLKLVSGGDRPTIFDEVGARFNERLPLARRPRDIKFILMGDDIAVQYGVSEPLVGAQLTPAELGRMRALVYVQDEPGFNNIDWAFSPQQTLQEAISGRFQARVIKLPRGDVARLKPAVIYDSAEGLTFRAVELGGRGRGVLQPRYFIGDHNPGRYGPGGRFVPRFYLPIVPCFNRDDDEDAGGRSARKDEEDDCDDDDDDTEVVVVRR